MRNIDIENFVASIGFVDACLLGEWTLIFCKKPGRHFADLKMCASGDFVARAKIIERIAASKVVVRKISGKRWRVYFPTEAALVAARRRLRYLFPELEL